MQIHKGARLGPYEVISAIGAGGMGEVWRARDTRLDRDVAIKILPSGFAEDAKLRIRFDREAKAISSLNHPHICTVHDVGHDENLHYLVMELIDGESLADRLQRGPLPPEQVLRYGAQIAAALDAAHRQGVIHRDLKPGNIMITRSGAKLLDFGLAKAPDAVPSTQQSALATAQKPITTEGTILGTYQYMSPEQLEGIDVDARTDIFALGAVLYEMATGRRAFQGNSRTSLIAAIVSSQPAPISSVAPMAPPALDHVVRKCLEKDREERWQSAHDVASELRWISEAGSQTGIASPAVSLRRFRKLILPALAITGWVAAAAAIGWVVRERASTQPLRRVFRSDFAFPIGSEMAFVTFGAAALSPDGQRVAYTRLDRSKGIAVYDFESGGIQSLDGTADGSFPFWSPDSRWIGFFADGKLKKVEARGGAVQVICKAPEGRGGSWSRNGTILFAPDIAGPLMKVPDGGGDPVAATTVADERWSHRNPHFLPDGEQFLFTARESRREAVGRIALGSLGGNTWKVVTRGSNPQYANGFVFYVRDRNLVTQRLDAKKAALIGSAVPVAQRVQYFNPRDLGNFSVSPVGTLVYRQSFPAPTQLTWIDRSGGVVGTVGDPGLYTNGRRNGSSAIATLLRRDENDQVSVWVMDLNRGTVTRSTENFPGLTQAVPAASGQQIAVSTWADEATTKGGLWLQSPSAAGAHRVLLQVPDFTLMDWSRDGKVIVGGLQKPGVGFDIVWLSVDQPEKIHAFGVSRFNETQPRLSPNGRWLAYMSDAGGSAETYISDFPEQRNRWQVTRSGGQPSTWSADGSELIVNLRGRLSAYPVKENGEALEIGAPITIPSNDIVSFLGAEKDKLLVLKRASETVEEPLRVVRNWMELVK